MPHDFSEERLVELPAIGLFAALGWTTVVAQEEVLGAVGTLGRETKGEVIKQITRSLINGLIRENGLETDGLRIRRTL